jgi:hypothetical protein
MNPDGGRIDVVGAPIAALPAATVLLNIIEEPTNQPT